METGMQEFTHKLLLENIQEKLDVVEKEGRKLEKEVFKTKILLCLLVTLQELDGFNLAIEYLRRFFVL